MKQNTLIGLAGVLVFAVVFLSSCEMVEGIFKAGMGVGIFIVIAVIALIIFVIMRLGRKG